MRKYNIKIKEVESNSLTEASNVSLKGILKILKSLTKNQPKLQVMNSKQSKLVNLSEPDAKANEIQIASLIKELE